MDNTHLWEPAQLVKASDRWYIKFYAFDERQCRRRKVKLTFNLNRIIDLRLRQRRAVKLVALLNFWMEAGRSPFAFSEKEALAIQHRSQASSHSLSVADAVDMVLKLKAADLRPDSMRSYNSIASMFLKFAASRGWDLIDVGQFSAAYAAAYLDDCVIRRKVSATTYNNNLRHMRAVFSVLVDREYLQHNPWKRLQFKRVGEKKRRNFRPDEAAVVVDYLYQNDKVLFLALLLQYACFIRPSELLRLRFENINIKKGIVVVEQAQAKTHKVRVATIPDDFLLLLPFDYLQQYPSHYLIFGKQLKPHRSKAAGKGSMYRRHQKVLNRLKEEHKLKDIDGLTWYSWKDTGITDALDYLPILSVQDQAGHSSPTMTLKYRHRRPVNEKIKTEFKNRILKKP